MVNYRRARVPGGTYFFTLTLRDRRSRVLIEHIDLLRESFRSARLASPFSVVAIVVLPDHLHALWTLPEGDQDYSGRWRAIKARFTRQVLSVGVEIRRDHRGEYRLWQRRFWEHAIRNEVDLARHTDYIHYNPVKHGLVARPGDWRWSSIHRYIRTGLLPADWAMATLEGEFGER